MTPQQLAAIKARADKATAGPWVFGPFGGGVMLYRAAGTRPIVLDAVREGTQWATFRLRDHDRCVMVKCDRNGPTYQIEHPDAEFIAQARTDVPALVAEVERLRGIEAAAKDMLNFGAHDGPCAQDIDGGKCLLHVATSNARASALRAALRAAGSGE